MIRSEWAPKICQKCEKTESEELALQFHSSDWWHEHMGIGAYFCPGCHKAQHRKESGIARRTLKKQQEQLMGE